MQQQDLLLRCVVEMHVNSGIEIMLAQIVQMVAAVPARATLAALVKALSDAVAPEPERSVHLIDQCISQEWLFYDGNMGLSRMLSGRERGVRGNEDGGHVHVLLTQPRNGLQAADARQIVVNDQAAAG